MKHILFILFVVTIFSCKKENSSKSIEKGKGGAVKNKNVKFIHNEREFYEFDYLTFSKNTVLFDCFSIDCPAEEELPIKPTDIQRFEFALYPRMGYRIIAKRLHIGMEKHYKGCGNYPKNPFGLLLESSDCYDPENSQFSLSIISDFLNLFKAKKVLFDFEDKKHIFRIFVYVNYDGKRLRQMLPFDSLVTPSGSAFYISCEKGFCIFIDFKGQDVFEKKFLKSVPYCSYPHGPKDLKKKGCEASVEEWSHMIRMYKKLKSKYKF